MEQAGQHTPFPTNLSLLRFFLHGSRRIFVLGMFFACLVSLLDMLGPRIISFTVDSVFGDTPPNLPAFLLLLLERAGGVTFFKSHPAVIAGIVILLALFAALFRYLFHVLNEIAAERLVKRMRDCLYEHIQLISYAWHGRNSTGDLIQRCTSDVETIKLFLSEQMTSLIRILVLIGMSVYFMVSIHPLMALLASLFIPVVVTYSLIFYSHIGNAFQQADEEEGLLSAITQENLTGVRVVRAFGREAFERDRFRSQNARYTSFWIRLMKILTLNWVTGDIMTGVQLLAVIAAGSYFCVKGVLTAGEFIAFVSYNSMLTWPVRSLGRVISEMSKAGISIDRLRYIMNAETEDASPDGKTPPMDRDIEFRHVSFSYENASGEALKDLSLSIPAGSTVGILGATGSGKSTLLYLLTKLYPLKEGAIEIGGVDIRDINTAYLRDRIGMVLQEPFLFSRSIFDNIRIAADSTASGTSYAAVDDTKDSSRAGGYRGAAAFDNTGLSAAGALLEAVDTAELSETISRFPSGFDTFVGERGVTLSGGQKQRCAIAQMLIRRCPVMIFDDSLSAVDAETDLRIRNNLRRVTKDATVILIAHRVTTLMNADIIYVLDDGQVRESGTYEELMNSGGLFRTICDLQMKAGEVS